MTKARDIADFKFENITDIGTEGTRIALGTTAQRGSTQGQIRFNSTTGLAEYYTGTEFKSIDTPPSINSVDVSNIATDSGGTETFVIAGSRFETGVVVKFRDNGGTEITPDTTTRNSASQITVTKTRSSFSNANEPYDVIVTNVSGLSATLDNAINVDNNPVWSTASGNIATIAENDTGNHATVSATDSDGDTIAYSLQSGSLGGLALNPSSGVISGDPDDVSADTTLNFTIRATANGKTADRAFNIVVQNIPNGLTASEPFTSFSHAIANFGTAGSNGVRYMQNQAGNAQYLLYFENHSGTVFAGIPIGSTSKTEGSRTVNGGTYFNGSFYTEYSYGAGNLDFTTGGSNQLTSNGGTGSGNSPNTQEVIRVVDLGIHYRYVWVDDLTIQGFGNNSADWSTSSGAVSTSNYQVTYSDSASVVCGKSGDAWNFAISGSGNQTVTGDVYSPSAPQDLTNTDNTVFCVRASGDKNTEYYTFHSGMIFFKA